MTSLKNAGQIFLFAVTALGRGPDDPTVQFPEVRRDRSRSRLLTVHRGFCPATIAVVTGLHPPVSKPFTETTADERRQIATLPAATAALIEVKHLVLYGTAPGGRADHLSSRGRHRRTGAPRLGSPERPDRGWFRA
jgi:hypothetical protein